MPPAMAQAADLAQAERAYRQGRFAAALGYYEAALRGEGEHRGAILFNMGNCAQRLGRLPEATLCYRRAWLLLPGDESIRTNLELVLRQLGAGPDAAADLVPAPPGVGPWLAAGGIVPALGLLGLLSARSKSQRRLAIATACLGLGAAAMALVRHLTPPAVEGVILASTELHSIAAADGAVKATLPAAAVVLITGREGDWLRIGWRGQQGWVVAALIGTGN